MELRAEVTASRSRNNDTSLATQLWGIDWKRFFPSEFPSFSVNAVDYRVFALFLQGHLEQIFTAEELRTPFLFNEPSESKTVFFSQFSDSFLFQAGDGVAFGAFLGNASDWASYYIRHVSLLPNYRGQGVYHLFLKRFCEILAQSGVERVELDVSPLNTAHIQTLNRSGFCVTGSSNSERWGSLLRFTRFLKERNHRVFAAQFSTRGPYGRPQS